MSTDGDPDAHQKPHRKLDWMGLMRISHIRWTPDGVCMRADDGHCWALRWVELGGHKRPDRRPIGCVEEQLLSLS